MHSSVAAPRRGARLAAGEHGDAEGEHVAQAVHAHWPVRLGDGVVDALTLEHVEEDGREGGQRARGDARDGACGLCGDDSWFGAVGLGVRVERSGFRVQGLGLRV